MKFLRALTAAALFAALFVLAIPVHADCGDGDPNCLLEPPISVEIRTDSNSGDASATVSESGALKALDFALPMPLPRRVEAPLVSAQSDLESTDSVPDFTSLSIPMRYQDPQDVSCGAQALGMALDGLGGSAPSSSSLWNFLEGQGMTYDFGTGVEELAHAAQNFGYSGSLPFHGWSLDQLMATLAQGKPVVTALGTNGEGHPGHFVTVTGISPDGNWVSYNDPTLGKQVISAEEFERLWSMQGSSGVSVAKAIPAGAPGGYAPWVALAAGLMALVSTTPMVVGRKGIGGVLLHDGSTSGSTGNPPYAAPSGYRWKRKLVTKYKTVWVQDGWTYENRTVPRYEKQRVQVGTTTVYDKIPQYKTVRVQDGWKTVYDRVAQYKNVRYVRYYRTTRKRVKRYRYYRGRRYFAGYSYVTRRTPVYSTKRIFNGYKKVYKRVPNYVNKRVLNGFKVIATEVPKYEWKDVKVGWMTEKVRVPNKVQKRVPDGVEVKWELERLPEPTPTATPRPESTPSPAYTFEPEPVPTPDLLAFGTPVPPAMTGIGEDGVQDDPGEVISGLASILSQGVKWVRKVMKIRDIAPLQFALLDGDYIGVRVSDAVPSGSKIPFRQDHGFAGTRYSALTTARISAGEIWESAHSNTGLGIALGLSMFQNAIDYAWGENKNKGFGNEFAASTMVDFAKAGIVGLASAGLMAGVVAGAAAAGIAVVASAPLWATMAVTAIVGGFISIAIDRTVDNDKLKQDVANGLSAWGGIVDNAGVIGGEIVNRISEGAESAWQDLTDVAKTAAEGVSSMAQGVSEVVSTGFEEAKEAVQEGISSVRDSIGGYFRNAFGGGSG